MSGGVVGILRVYVPIIVVERRDESMRIVANYVALMPMKGIIESRNRLTNVVFADFR